MEKTQTIYSMVKGWIFIHIISNFLYSGIKKSFNANEVLLQKVMKRKLELFSHSARMNSRKITKVVMGKTDGDNRKARPYMANTKKQHGKC